MTKPITMLCNGSMRRLPPSPCHNRFQPVALPCCLACSTYMLQGVRTAVQWCLYAAAGGGRNASAGAAWGGGYATTQCAADQACPAKAARLYPQRQLNIT